MTTMTIGSAMDMFPSATKILKALANDYKVVDDHNNRFEEIDCDMPMIQIKRHEVNVVFGTTTSALSINPLYLSEDDGKVHLSPWSCGRVVRFDKWNTTEEAIDSYNNHSDGDGYYAVKDTLIMLDTER